MDRKNLNIVVQPREKTYVYLWTCSQFKQEQTEWDAVNRVLQHHGFKPVHFADPMENKNLADLVILEKKAAAEIRLMLKTMVTDSERRQALIQELIQSNSQLKEEVQQQQARAAQQAQRAAELQGVLDTVKAKVQGLEDSYINKAAQQHVQVKQLLQDQKEAQERHQALEQKLAKEREVIAQLQQKLYFAVKEEERRVARQNQVFQQIQKRSIRPHSPLDQRVLDVIDVYEAQIHELHTELKDLKEGHGGKDQADPQPDRKNQESNASDSRKALLKSYQEQLKETKAQREELRGEIQRLKQDLEYRPTVKELKSYKHQLRRMERIIQQSKLGQPAKADEDSADVHSTELENIERLQANVCRRYLKSACQELEVQDLTHLVPAIKLRARQAESCLRLVKILSAIKTTLSSPRAPVQLLKQKPSRQSHNGDGQDVEFEELHPVVEMWAEQLSSLKELQCAMKKLMQRLLPWQPIEDSSSPQEGVRVEELLLMVDTLLEETAKSDSKEMQSPTKHSLKSMVSHFQKLFDVASLSGVYPRMNEVYTKLGEMTNAMRNLRDVLGMDDRAPPSEVVNQVAQVTSSMGLTTSQELHNLLGTSDIDSIITKLEEHEEFFPAFHALVQQLLQTLDIQCLDDILPAVCQLKSRTD
ncbi:centrosomal protein of 70 kDa [Megalops cyprinoides]|uniref:centrosomal protein of 70 kDa n=1 Tax=Megalops cyprinoides TaxID=118141 RepID=UPI001864C790|nr:centrosomal protein of 70 kDa [Megalops cyprinoides]